MLHIFMPYNDREVKALLFASGAHYGQLRKYTGEAYINHPCEVANLVRSAGGTSDMVIAALLHDTVEDTDVTLEEVMVNFGQEVTDLVYWLTDVSRPEHGNRKARKLMDLQHIAIAPAEAKTIKLADLVSNTKSIAQHDPDFWKVYREEKLALLGVLTEGDPGLYETAYAQVTA